MIYIVIKMKITDKAHNPQSRMARAFAGGAERNDAMENLETMKVEELRRLACDRGLGSAGWRATARKTPLIQALRGDPIDQSPEQRILDALHELKAGAGSAASSDALDALSGELDGVKGQLSALAEETGANTAGLHVMRKGLADYKAQMDKLTMAMVALRNALAEVF